MRTTNDIKRGICLDEAQKILHDNGLDISTEQAKQLLDFLYLFAVFSIEQVKHKHNENS
jgi:hypothetical protein